MHTLSPFCPDSIEVIRTSVKERVSFTSTGFVGLISTVEARSDLTIKAASSSCSEHTRASTPISRAKPAP